MSDKPQTRVNRHFKALFRWLDYVAQKPVFARVAAKDVRPARPDKLGAWEIWRFRRWLFWKHGGAECGYCGRSMPLDCLTIDHIQPRSKGGAVRDINNMVLACIVCNRDKGNDWKDYTTES